MISRHAKKFLRYQAILFQRLLLNGWLFPSLTFPISIMSDFAGEGAPFPHYLHHIYIQAYIDENLEPVMISIGWQIKRNPVNTRTPPSHPDFYVIQRKNHLRIAMNIIILPLLIIVRCCFACCYPSNGKYFIGLLIYCIHLLYSPFKCDLEVP